MEFIRVCGLVLPDWRRSFILTLRGLSGPKTAIAGNRYGMIAMAIAVVTILCR